MSDTQKEINERMSKMLEEFKPDANKIVTEALFGDAEIEHEPGNYYLHRNTFLAAVERAIAQEREACAKTVERVAWSSPSADAEYAMRQVAKVAAADIRARSAPPSEADNG